MPTFKELLKRGIETHRAGDKRKASQLFQQAIQMDRNSQEAWLWLAACVEDAEYRRKCILTAYNLDPKSSYGKQAEKALAHASNSPPPPTPLVQNQRREVELTPLPAHLKAKITYSTPPTAQSSPPKPVLSPSSKLDTAHTVSCRRCQKLLDIEASTVTRSRMQRCDVCEKEVTAFLRTFREQFKGLTVEQLLNQTVQNSLQAQCRAMNVTWEEAIGTVRDRSIYLLDKYFSRELLQGNGELSSLTELNLRLLQGFLHLRSNHISFLLKRVIYLKRVREIRRGEINPIRISFQLGLREKAYADIAAVQQYTDQGQPAYKSGRMIITNVQFMFLSSKGKIMLPLHHIVEVRHSQHTVKFTTTASPAQDVVFIVSEPLLAAAMLATLIDAQRGVLSIRHRQAVSQYAMHYIKGIVRQRDKNSCVRCGSHRDLLFKFNVAYNQGGTPTVENVYLICKICSQKTRNVSRGASQ